MSHQEVKTTNRSEAWIEILTGVENALETTLDEVARREQTLSVRPDPPRLTEKPGRLHPTWLSRLALCPEQWQGLWLRSAESEKDLSNAEAVLAAAEGSLRQQLDRLVVCRQDLAQWLSRAVG